MRLAGPWRRGLAMSIDGLLVAVLANAPGFLLAAAASWVFFRVSARSAPGGYVRATVRFGFRALAALLLFVTVMSLWGSAKSRFGGERDSPRVTIEMEAGESTAVAIGALQGLGTLRAANRLKGAETQAEAAAAAAAVAEQLSSMGVPPEDRREVIRELLPQPEADWVPALLDSVAGEPGDTVPGPAAGAADSLISAAAAAYAAGDSARAGSLQRELVALLARDTLGSLGGELAAARGRNRALAAELAEERESGVGLTAVWRAISDDLGVGLGWSGLYFTAFLALWSGQTPGKRLLGIRVVRLDGEPLGWWAAFERFGGYAASFATGLLGFAQIFWDANRQAIHDKIVHTAVVIDGPSIQQGIR